MWALADCNTFFASVERALHPGLHGKPVCVLSSNDGIIVALTAEAKALGLRRGDPIFKVKETIDRNHVAVFSGNMMLYAAMSQRVQGIMRQYVEYSESYSIDEQFLLLDGYEKHYDLAEYMRDMASRIRLWTDIPVSIGIAPSKTLAKVGSKFAKQYRGYRSVCVIDTDEKRRKALAMSDLADVWGIGRRSCEKLLSLGVRAPLEFADKPVSWVHRYFNKPGVQTWKELNGYPCISTEEILQRQSITTSRSFGEMITSLAQLKASVAHFAASCANKLRGQGSVAGTMTVFVCSNSFREDLRQYSNAATWRFAVGTADTVEITEAAMLLVEAIYKPGIHYKKSGVIMGDIYPDAAVQQVLFDNVARRPERLGLSRAIDAMNHKYGLKTVSLAVEGGKAEAWAVRSEHRTPNYLTDIDELLTVQI